MIKIFIRIIKDMFRVIPAYVVRNILLNIAHGFSMVLLVALTQHFFDNVAAVAAGAPVRQGLAALVFFLLGTVGMEVCNGLANFPTEFLSPKMQADMHERLHRKASAMGAASYEDPDSLDCICKAGQGIEAGVRMGWYVLSVLTFYLPYYIFMSLYLRNLSPFLLLILLCVFVPVAIGKFLRFRIFRQAEDEIAPARRAMEYYERAICDRDYFKETRLWGAFGYFIELFRSAIGLVNGKLLKAELKHMRVDFLLRLLMAGGYVGILAILVKELLGGKITAGAFAAVFSGLGMMFGLAEEVFGGILNSISRNAASVYNYYKFLDLLEPGQEGGAQDQMGQAGPAQVRKGLVLENVTFRYPGASRNAVGGVSLVVPQGKTMAVVGENGSGKTTLVRLMCGLYRPDSGHVWVNGLDTRAAEAGQVTGQCSAVFQNFQRYRMTLGENVRISDWEREDGREGAFLQACREAEVDISGEAFPQGGDTMLSREFGGVDLSGGQWQRVAMARGLYRGREILFLDEPTSAIDPLEETRVYQEFIRLSQGKTAVIVTHRIGAAQIADVILVMQGGRIAEMGSHQQLLQKGGFYARMYHEQAKWYKEG